MQTLILDRKGCRLSLDAKRIRIKSADLPVQFVPVKMINRVVISARIGIESNVLGALAAAGVAVLFLSPRDNRRTALVLPPHGHDHALRLQQYAAVTDAGVVIRISRAIVRMKLAGQRRALQNMSLSGPLFRQAYRAFPEIQQRIRVADSLESIRGFEGGAASIYFRAIAESVPPSLQFSGRRRRPPPDPLNALLSLSYTLLHFDAVRLLYAAGLDPSLGFLHSPEYNRESLACDCIEPLRPLADRFVLGLFRKRILRPDHFSDQQGACLLAKTGRSIFYARWEQFSPLPRRSVRRGIVVLKRAIRAKSE